MLFEVALSLLHLFVYAKNKWYHIWLRTSILKLKNENWGPGGTRSCSSTRASDGTWVLATQQELDIIALTVFHCLLIVGIHAILAAQRALS